MSVRSTGATTHLMCLTSSGGIPLFTRKKGDGDALPFSVVASLNGVYMFGKSQSTVLKSTSTEDATVVWREFEDSITLIVSAVDSSESELVDFLETVFNAMVLFVGIHELREPRNVERLKRDLRVCYPLFDRLLSSIHPSEKTMCCSDLSGMVECTMYQENHVVQVYLEAHVESLASMYGSVLLHGKLSVATPSWWTLSPLERTLLALLVATDAACTLRDLPVFLPDKSPDVPFRLVTCQLSPGVEVCTLCGPTPPMSEVHSLAAFTWRNAGDILRAVAHPRTLPDCLGLDRHIMGLLLVNTELGKYVICADPHSEAVKEGRAPNTAYRTNVLRTFYRKMMATFMKKQLPSSVEKVDAASTSKAEGCSGQEQMLESYWCSEFHKCHALLSAPNQLFVLYTSAVPTQTTRAISRQTLKILLSEKLFCWYT